MSVIVTSAALAACLILLGTAIVLDRRPYRPGKFNYIPMMILLTTASLALGRYLLTLTTGL